MRRSAGAVLLAQTGKTSGDIAEELGCSRPYVQHFLSGARKPLKKWRVLMRDLYKIPTKAWDEEPNEPKLPPLANGAKLKDQKTKTILDALRKSVVAQVEAAQDPSLSVMQRQKIERSALDLIEKIEDAATVKTKLSEEQILRTPAGQRLIETILGVLKPHKEIRDELLARLEELDRE